jgi:hypothetical protein
MAAMFFVNAELGLLVAHRSSRNKHTGKLAPAKAVGSARNLGDAHPSAIRGLRLLAGIVEA